MYNYMNQRYRFNDRNMAKSRKSITLCQILSKQGNPNALVNISEVE